MKHNVQLIKVIFVIALISVMIYPAKKAFAEVQIKTEVDKEEAVLGERISLDVILTGTEGLEVVFPEELSDAGDFSFIESRAIKAKRFGPKIEGRTYVFGIYETGTHVIPPIEVKYRTDPTAEWTTIASSQMPVEVDSVLKGDETDIRDIKGLEALPVGVLLIVVVVIIVIVAGVLVWWIFGRVKSGIDRNRKVIERSAHEIAYEELEHLKSMELPKQGRIKEYYIGLSDITRHYLERRFSYRVPEMTTEEFLNHLKTVSEILKEHKELLKEFLTQCDMVKFAKYGPTPLEVLDSFKLAEKIVTQTKLIEEDITDEDTE